MHSFALSCAEVIYYIVYIAPVTFIGLSTHRQKKLAETKILDHISDSN